MRERLRVKARVAAILMIFALGHVTSAWALDPQSVKEYCDNLAKAAQDAQRRYIEVSQPRTDPVQTFGDATKSCLGDIAKFPAFEPKLPGVGDLGGVLSKIGKELTEKVCRTATDQFDRAVADAMGSVTQPVNQLPGVDIYGNARRVGGNVSVEPAIRGAADQTVDRVINFVK